MIFNKNLPTSMRVVGAKVVRAFASVLHRCVIRLHRVYELAARVNNAEKLISHLWACTHQV